MKHIIMRKKGPSRLDKQRRVVRWLFVCAFIMVLGLLLANCFFHLIEKWQRILQTGIPVLILLGLILIQQTKRQNAQALQQKLDELERTVKRTANN